MCLSSSTKSTFYAVMGTVVGNQIAGSLPKALQSMLNVLVASNNLRSWQIYNDSLGISVRLRFDHDGGCVDRGDREGNVYMQSSQPNTAQQTQPTAYCKKSPSHVKRDTQEQKDEELKIWMRLKMKDR